MLQGREAAHAPVSTLPWTILGRCDATQLVEDLHLAQVAGEDDAVNLIDHVGYLGAERNGYRQRPGAGWYRRSALCLDAKGVFRKLSADTNMDVSG